MDILDILREAKNPNVISAKPDQTVDYADEIESQDEDTTENGNTVTDTDEVSDSDTDSDTDNEEDDSVPEEVDYGEQLSGNEDYSDETDNQSTTDSDNNSMNTEEDDIPDIKQNSSLIEKCIDLHTTITNIINRVDSITGTDANVNKIVIKVKSNLNELRGYLYDFITGNFSNNPYVKNLYIYNYFIESLKINIEMLSKIEHFNNRK